MARPVVTRTSDEEAFLAFVLGHFTVEMVTCLLLNSAALKSALAGETHKTLLAPSYQPSPTREPHIHWRITHEDLYRELIDRQLGTALAITRILYVHRFRVRDVIVSDVRHIRFPCIFRSPFDLRIPEWK